MNAYRELGFLGGLLALSVLACNLGASVPSQRGVDLNQALTLAVQTLQAATQQAGANAPISTLVPPTNTSIPPTAAPPTVTVSSDTNCRTGPSQYYAFVMLFQPGMSAEVVAKYTPANYWIIKYPGGNGATCWLWGQYATVIGDTNSLPEGVPPPLPPTATSAPTAPNPPKGVHLSCTSVNKSKKVGNLFLISFEWTVKVKWTDNSDNESGFYVYKDGSIVATLPVNSTSYTDVFTVALLINPPTHTYGVASFNSYGTSAIKDVELTSCP